MEFRYCRLGVCVLSRAINYPTIVSDHHVVAYGEFAYRYHSYGQRELNLFLIGFLNDGTRCVDVVDPTRFAGHLG